MTKRSQRPSGLRIIALAGCGAILVWLVLSRSLAAYLAEVAPQEALRLNPGEPTALVNLADRAFNGSAIDKDRRAQNTPEVSAPQGSAAGQPADSKRGAANAGDARRAFSEFDFADEKKALDLPSVRAWAEASLTNEPLNARALRILGQAAAAAGNDPDAAKFMHAAARLSLHESAAIFWMLVRSAKIKDYRATVYYGDTILRTLPGFDAYVVPIMAQVVEDKESAGLLTQVLMDNPPWRDIFLQRLPSSVVDQRVPLELLLALRKSPQPPSRPDINSYLDFLVQHRKYQLAYYTWLQFLPDQALRNVGLLYNGNFDVAPTGSPFDWLITQGSGVDVDIEERPDKRGAHALVIDFRFGRVEYHSVRQLIMLPPGEYRFEGQYKGELVGPRGLKWRIACAESPAKPFAESAMIKGSASAWNSVKVDFTVPDQHCPAQYLSLDLDARMPSEEFVTGTISLDNLQISRLTSAAQESNSTASTP